MKLVVKKIAALALVSAPVMPAFAGVYGEVGFHGVDNSKPRLPTATVGMVSATLGYEFNENIAFEVFAASGVVDGGIRSPKGPASDALVEAEGAYGVFLKPKVALSESFELFAKVGMVSTEIKTTSAKGVVTENSSDFAYGAGAQFNFTRSAYVSGGYTNWYDKEGTTIDGWNLGLGYKF